MKITFLIIFLLSFGTASSQDLVKQVSVELKSRTDVFQIVEEDKKQVTLFFSDKRDVKMIRFNEQFDILDSLSTIRPSKDFDNVIGHSIDGDNYYTYWPHFKEKRIESLCFNFSSKKITSSSIPIDLGKEKLFKRITVNNVFYLLTIVKGTSILNCYVLNKGQLEKKTIDLTLKVFYNSENKKTVLWEILNQETNFESELSVQDIFDETPPSLVLSANKRKVYPIENNLIFTFDTNKNYTQFLILNLTDFSVSQKLFTQPYFEETEFNTPESNSFLIDDQLIQLKSNPSRMQISIKNVNDGSEIKSLEVLLDREIEFKNSEIIQENLSVKNTRVLDQSNQLIRKLTYLNPSVSCYEENGIYYLTLGGVSMVQNNNAVAFGAMIGGLSGALIGALISPSYSVSNLRSYQDRKVVYINCLFDQQFNHVKGNVTELPFDTLRKFDQMNKWLSDKTIFKINANLYLGAYSVSEKKYSFYKF